MTTYLECFKPLKNAASPCHTPLSFQKCFLDATYYLCSYGMPKANDIAKIKKLAVSFFFIAFFHKFCPFTLFLGECITKDTRNFSFVGLLRLWFSVKYAPKQEDKNVSVHKKLLYGILDMGFARPLASGVPPQCIVLSKSFTCFMHIILFPFCTDSIILLIL